MLPYTSCETKRHAVGNILHPSTKYSVESYTAPVPAYGQQQQLPMADMNHLGQRQRVRGWHPARVPQPSQIRDDHPAQFKKQTEKDIKYPRNATTPNTTTTIPTSSTHDDEQQPPPIITHVNPPTCPAWRPTTRRYRTIRMKHAESPSQTIDDLHAHYQKILTKSDSKRLRNTTTTTITTSPTRDDEQHPL